MSIKDIISSLKSKLSSIFGTKKIKRIEDKQYSDTKKFRERLQEEYDTSDKKAQVVDIERLNSVIEENLRHRKNRTNYKLLRVISEKMARGIQIGDRRNNEIKTLSEPQDTLKIALDFFKSIDEELYKQAKAIIDGDSEVEFRMYKLKDIQDFDEVEYDGLPKYSRTPCVSNNSNRTIMYIPLEGTAEDIFILVHELSHTFDLNTKNESNNSTRNMLGGSNSFMF